jgi:hypothetical protein
MTAISIAEWISFIGLAITLGLGLMNYYNLKSRGQSMGMLERGQYLKSVNEAVDLANSRALAAEQRVATLEDKLTHLEGTLSYRLTFDVVLGEMPLIEKVSIEHYPDRRQVNIPHDVERRGRK